jgi:5-methylcytosine-specific restriction enzyme A
MQVGGITRAGILQAIAEHDRLGVDAFRASYGFRAAVSWVLLHEGRTYDSKAIAGVAHLYDFGQALKPSQFSGGKDHSVAWLRREGFTVEKVPKSFISRVGDIRPQRRGNDLPLHRPLLMLWAIGQAVAGAPRLQPWSRMRDALAPLLVSYAAVQDGFDAARYPFWALMHDDLWVVEQSDRLNLTSQGRRPTLDSLNHVNPLAGLREDDYNLVRSRPDVAAQAAAGLVLRFFSPLPAGLLEDFALYGLLEGRWPEALRPLPGEQFKDRDAIWRVYGGQKMAGIGCLADGILSAFSDDKGPYADGRLPDSDWIAYVGDGLSGDQKLTDGNEMLAEYQADHRPVRYWHKPYQKQFTFEAWAVIIQRRLRWGRGEDGKWRREFVWVLAPVPSVLPDTWPTDVVEALDSDAGELYDETVEYLPSDVDLTEPSAPESAAEAYLRLTIAAESSAKLRGRSTRLSAVDRAVRSQSARAAVIRRSSGSCESPQCAGHPKELTSAGQPILQVDHVRDLAKGGADLPWNMLALCPNCHALKTYGVNRERLTRLFRQTARRLHDEAIG